MTTDDVSRTPEQGIAAGDGQAKLGTTFVEMARRAALAQYAPHWPLIAKMYDEWQIREAREAAWAEIESSYGIAQQQGLRFRELLNKRLGTEW